ncbi:MAG: VTT domain-containing protein [Acidobacteria bacterium]|nr:VTT domain-containing protein [Acidobacteriota bacterium]
MTELWGFLLKHGHGLLFAVVLAEQLGAPLPAVPVLMVMGALAGLGYYSISSAFLLSIAACLLADYFWFELGRRRGNSILAFLCKLSLEPDSCVRTTTGRLERWGPATLLFAKFIPGLSAVAPPLAGSAGITPARFLVYDGTGAAIWSASALFLGFLLQHEVRRIFDWLPRIGSGLLLLILTPLAAWILWKIWQRRRAIRLARISRIQPDDLAGILDRGEPLALFDLRSASAIRKAGARIPGALTMDEKELSLHLRELPGGTHLVFYCT